MKLIFQRLRCFLYGNEPNDSPFETTAFSGNTASASLHVVNDQDWYTVQVDQTDIYSVKISSYATEIHYAVTGMSKYN